VCVLRPLPRRRELSLSPEVTAGVIAGVGALATFGLTFVVRRVAEQRGLIALPDAEHVHQRATPLGGGVALTLGFAIAIAVSIPFGVFKGELSEAVGIVAAAAVMTGVGLLDDIRPVSPPAKVAGQVLGAMVLYFFGITMTHVKIPFFSFIVLTSAVLPLVTALWVIGTANAVNFIDGLDGLAAGVVAIGAGALCIYGFRCIELGALLPNNIGPIIAAACCGVCVGFLPHNFHKAKIFMGDAGAMVLGLLMAAATMEIGGQATYVVSGTTYFFFAPLIVPIAILGVPIFDTALAIVRRTIRRSGVTERDLGHIHYKLMRLGHGHRRSVLLLWVWTLLLSGLVLYPTFDPSWNGAVPFVFIGLAVVLLTLFRPGAFRRGSHLSGSAKGLAILAGQASDQAPPDVGDPLLPPTPGGPNIDEANEYHRATPRRFARHRPPMRG
jgi:UDP-GlcNAc:undecaprenyl-phosphate GlcNAc-1-phosphate transferase